MSDVLAIAGQTSLTTQAPAEVVKAMTKTGDYLPRIQVCGGSSDIVKEGKLPIGTHGLVWTADKFQDLGKEINFISLTFRPRAMQMNGKTPISYFDRESDDFKRVQTKADQEGFGSGCFWGPEFLIWLPDVSEFAGFFLNNPTLRRVGGSLYTIMHKGGNDYAPAAATSKVKLIDNGKHKWHGVDFFPYSGQIPPAPDGWTEKLGVEMERFKNPPKSLVETVPAGETDTRER